MNSQLTAEKESNMDTDRFVLRYPEHFDYRKGDDDQRLRARALDLSTLDIDVQSLIDCGYRRTSRKYGILARIDRPDWKEWFAENTHLTAAEVDRKAECDPYGGIQSHYACLGSRDHIKVKLSISERVPSSGQGRVDYVPMIATIKWEAVIEGAPDHAELLREIGISYGPYDAGYFNGCVGTSQQFRTARERGLTFWASPIEASFVPAAVVKELEAQRHVSGDVDASPSP